MRLRNKCEGYLLTAQAASCTEAARTRSGLWRETGGPLVPMSRKTRKRLRTDGAHRGGVARSSEERSVIGLQY